MNGLVFSTDATFLTMLTFIRVLCSSLLLVISVRSLHSRGDCNYENYYGATRWPPSSLWHVPRACILRIHSSVSEQKRRQRQRIKSNGLPTAQQQHFTLMCLREMLLLLLYMHARMHQCCTYTTAAQWDRFLKVWLNQMKLFQCPRQSLGNQAYMVKIETK